MASHWPAATLVEIWNSLPGVTPAERFNNAIDAALAIPTIRHGTLSGPREAAAQWFGPPESGPDTGMYNWKHGNIDDAVQVILRPGAEQKHMSAPTVDVFDAGNGIRPEDFARTILSLQGGNKINKWYLAGTFGQGGSATLAFADFTLIMSRSKSPANLGEIGFTLIRELDLGDQYKEDCYAYLADANGQVLSFVVEGAFNIDDPALDKSIALPALEHGTLVRHYQYKLPTLDGPLISTPGNLYHYFGFAMADPLIPFRVKDARPDYIKERTRDEIITGARNRLMKLVGRPSKELGSEIMHYRAMEYVKPAGSVDPSIGIEYWVIFSRRKVAGTEKKKGKADIILRPSSNELFILPNHPVIGTMNGQTQGELTAKVMKDIGLTMLSRHMVIHIDATRADSRTRRELFATTREGFKEGSVLSGLEETLKSILLGDPMLFDIERQLAERMIQMTNIQTAGNVTMSITKLLTDGGLKATSLGPVIVKGGNQIAERLAREPNYTPTEPGETPGETEATELKTEPLPPQVAETLPFPEATKLSISAEKLDVKGKANKMLMVTTDAAPEFMERGLVGLRFEPAGTLEVVSTIPQTANGVFGWRVRVVAEAADSPQEGKAIVTLTKPDGSQLTDEKPFTFTPVPEEGRGKRGQGNVPPFEVIPISPRDVEQWSTVWPELPPDKTSDKDLKGVAFKALQMGDTVYVYYSTVFTDFMRTYEHVKKVGTKAFAELYQTNYAIWLGYHAVSQTMDGREEESSLVDPEIMERVYEQERTRVARMEARQALATAQMEFDLRRLAKARTDG